MTRIAMLNVFLFGAPRVAIEDGASNVALTRAAKGLLAYLVLGRRRHHPRNTLAATFWPDLSTERARCALNTALWRLRRALEPGRRGAYLHTDPSGDIGFNAASEYWLDVESFERYVARFVGSRPEPLDATAGRKLGDVLDLYTGDLLEGFDQDWVLPERERLRGLYLDGMTVLMRFHHAHSDPGRALAYGRRIVRVEPLREEVHRELMDLYVETGQRPLAARQYESFRDVLRAELGIAPTAETHARYADLVGSRHLAAGPPTVPAGPADRPMPIPGILPGPPSLQQAISEVYAATVEFERAHARLCEAQAALQRTTFAMLDRGTGHGRQINGHGQRPNHRAVTA